MKNAVVTGGNSGIGLEAAKKLLNKGYRVLIAARSETKLVEAKEFLEKQTGSSDILTYSVDLSDFDAVKEFANAIKNTMPQIDILALNAGLYTGARYKMGKSGYELMISATHLGHFLLTHLLLPTLVDSEETRIIVTSSAAHLVGGLDIKSFTKPKYAFLPYVGPAWGYGQSKLANILFTRELARRIQNKKFTVNCFHPGSVASGFLRHVPNFVIRLVSSSHIDSEEGSRTLFFLADDAEVGKISGEYFYRKRVRKTNSLGESDTLAKRLWQESERIVSPFIS